MRAVKLSDEELIRLMHNGGKDLERAFRYMINDEKRSQSIQKLVFGLGAGKEDYEEILDDTLVALYTNVRKGTYQEQFTLKAYMRGIARNLWYKRWREKKIKAVPIENAQFAESELTVESHIIRGERRQILMSFIDKLGAVCRKILVKAFFEGLKNQELIEVMNYKNEAVVRKKKSQCLNKLVSMFRDRPDLINQLRI